MDKPVSQGETVPEARQQARRAEHCVEIAAPIGKVWDELAHFEGWGRWNPLYVETEGAFAPGKRIEFTVALPGMKPQKGHATVLAVRPRELVEYRIVSAGGLTWALRYIELREVGPGRCTVTNGEIMHGPLGGILFLFFGKRVRQGLQGMNEALKARVEASA